MNRSTIKILNLGLAAILSATTSNLAQAQYATGFSPEQSDIVDENGVHLVTGKFEGAVRPLSIGKANSRIDFDLRYRGGWVDRFQGCITGYEYHRLTVNIGDYSETFQYNLNGTFDSLAGKPGRLSSVLGGYEYLQNDGTKVFYDSTFGFTYPGVPKNQGCITLIQKANGERINVKLAMIDQTVGSNTIKYTRPNSVSSSNGWLLSYEYIANNPTWQSNWDLFYPEWAGKKKVTALNLAVDYCDTNALSCANLSQTWPSVSWTYSGTSQNRQENFQNSAGHIETYNYNYSDIKSVRSAGRQSDNLIIRYNSNGTIATFALDGVLYAYSWSVAPVDMIVSVNRQGTLFKKL